MRRITIFALLITFLVLMLTACTPPPPPEEMPEETDTTEVDQTATEDPDKGPDEEIPPTDTLTETVEGDVETTSTSPGISESDDGATSTVVTDPEEGESEEPTEEETEAEVETDSDAVPEDIFGYYETWPADSITDEEVELLRNIVVVFETSKGIIKLVVFPDQAPLNSANFVKLVQEGFYDGTVFHRVIEDFMSQGGDPTGTGSGGPGYTVPAEIGLTHDAGRLSAARQGNNMNPEMRSSGSQFFLCHTLERTQSLDGQYTVYGEIIEGQDVNLSLSINYTGRGPIAGAPTDTLIRAWVEWR